MQRVSSQDLINLASQPQRPAHSKSSSLKPKSTSRQERVLQKFKTIGGESAATVVNDDSRIELPPADTEIHASRKIISLPSGSKGTTCGRKFVGEWELGATIGEGSTGKVKLAKHRITNETCVVKAVRRPKMSNGQTATETHVQLMDKAAMAKVYKRELFMIREAALGSMLDHPNIVKLNSAVLGENHFYCFFELAVGEDLVDHISKNGAINSSLSRKIFRQMISAIGMLPVCLPHSPHGTILTIEYIHRNHIVHRDIKLENIRYDCITGHVKLLDFGFATFYNENLLNTNCGSPCYAAPEIYDNKPYIGPASDIWSLGVCLFGMVTATLPFDGVDFKSLAARVRSGKFTYHSLVKPEITQLIHSMLRVHVKSRVTMKDILENEWLNRGFDTKPLDYLEFNDRQKEAAIPEYLVNSLIGTNVCNSGSILMTELKARIPAADIALEISKQKVIEDDTLSNESHEVSENYGYNLIDRGKQWLARVIKKFGVKKVAPVAVAMQNKHKPGPKPAAMVEKIMRHVRVMTVRLSEDRHSRVSTNLGAKLGLKGIYNRLRHLRNR